MRISTSDIVIEDFTITCDKCGGSASIRETPVPAQQGYSESYGAYTIVSIKCNWCNNETVIFEG